MEELDFLMGAISNRREKFKRLGLLGDHLSNLLRRRLYCINKCRLHCIDAYS